MKPKSVVCYNLFGQKVAEYNSLTEAAKAVNGTQSGISQCLKGQKKTHRNLYWKFKNDDSPLPVHRNISIYGYNSQGKLFSWDSPKSVEKSLNADDTSVYLSLNSSITSKVICKGYYLFRTRDGFYEFETIVPKAGKIIYGVNSNGKVKQWKSQSCAAKELGCTRQAVSQSIQRKIKCKDWSLFS